MKKILIITVLMLLSSVSLKAQEIQLYNDSLMYFADEETICANRTYYLDSTTEYQEIVVKDAQTNVIYEVYNANSTTSTLVFPENAGTIEIVTTDYDATGHLDPATESSATYVVEPCEYEVIKADYEVQKPYAKFELSDATVSVTPPTDVQDYVFSYKFVDQSNGRDVDATEPFTIELEENTVLQFTESYTNSDGEAVTKYYELEINPVTNTFFIRNVDTFSINTIDVKSLINWKILVIMLIMLFLIIFFASKHKRLKRKIKKKNESRR